MDEYRSSLTTQLVTLSVTGTMCPSTALIQISCALKQSGKKKGKDGSIHITSLHIFCVLKQSGMIKNKARLIHIAWLHISWFFKVSGIISMAQIVLPHQTSLGPEGDQGQSGTTIFQSECHQAHYLVTHLLDLKVVRD